MSSERLNVLVIGYGSVGSYVIPELLSPLYLPRVHTLLLVRPASLQDDSKSAKLKGWAEQGASIVQGDITDGEEALARLMRAHRVHTVLCLVGYPQLGQQMPVLAAAQAAGVQHFFPSEFGMDVEALPEGGTMEAMRATRLAVRQAVRASGLPWTVVNAGYFAEYVFNSPFFGVDIRSRTVTAPVSFDVCISLASLVDVARQTALMLLDPAVKNRTVYLGEERSYSQLADLVESATGSPAVRKVASLQEAEEAMQRDPTDFAARYVSITSSGRGTRWPASRTYTASLPHYQPVPLLSVAQEAAREGAQPIRQ